MITEYEDVLYETKGRIAIVTLNRPEKMNALSHRLRAEMFSALKDAEADADVRVVIIRGAGRTFSAGYDITPVPNLSESDYLDLRSGLPSVGPIHPGRDSGRSTCSAATGRSGSWPSRSSPRCTATAWRAAPSWPACAT